MSLIKKYIYLVFLFASGIFAGIGVNQYYIESKVTIPLTPLQDLLTSTKIEMAYDILSTNYYRFQEHDKTLLRDGVIRGIVNSLEDKHSEFFTAEEAKQFNDTLAGDFEGIGAVIDDNPKGILVEKIIPGSPAEKAGVTAGNIIVEVSGESMLGVVVKDAVKKIRGPKGTPVVLKLFDPIDSTFQTKTVIRDAIIVPSVQEKVLTGGVLGYIEVSIFGEKTSADFAKALKNLSDKKVKGIIIDLRYNGGGYLDEAVHMLSNFIPKATPLVTTKETDPKKNETLFSEGGNYLGIPLVFLVNDMTASASEIMAGAMQDIGRGVIVGTKTYGKGSVQQPFLLPDGSELKITIAKWYTPKDRGIDGIGIKPDIEIPIKDEDYKNRYDRQIENAKTILEFLIESGSRDETIKKFNQI